ncbi:MAG: hypothetical protein J0G30_05225 [Actinomycetales bacterium]|nr:hypothetical protein [Actinomycetales bacterium]
MVGAIAACWLLVALPITGFAMIGVAPRATYPPGTCIELCSDWLAPLAAGSFAFIFLISVLATATVASALTGSIAEAGRPEWILMSAGAVTLTGAGWIVAVAFGAPAEGLEIVAGLLVALACIVHLAMVIASRPRGRGRSPAEAAPLD